MRAALVAGLLAGFGVAVPVGAVGAYLVALTARTSLRTGACAALGVATADGLYALLAAAGGTGLAPLLAPFAGPLRIASAVVLLALAVRTARSALRSSRPGAAATPEREPPSPARAFLTLLGITLLNPLTVLYFTALVLGSGAREGAASDALARAVFAAAAFAASAGWQLLLASGGALLGRALTGPRGRLLTALGSSTLVAGLAVRLLVG
ncbi:LysE family transporter [Streptomyces sp. 1331.2]|uniref:LysE family transporter n=1 Tax=Streptomyces sp. 1331.2 TaxID=1938835 RepID=UPI000BCC67C5|nr:LysE family transporter [Streptomyces sp. 1331.2]SOB85848.1 Arginine exporter protein ArgO [Streptomyces sp. 1331.2]